MNAHSPKKPTASNANYGGPDRRRNHRYMGQDLTCLVDGRTAAVQDISEGGLRVAINGVMVGQIVEIRMETTGIEPAKTTAKVLSADGTRSSLAFTSPTYALMKFVIHYLANHHGMSVHAFR